MTMDNHVIAPDTNITDPWFWDPQVHFPMNVLLMQDPTVGIKDIKNLHEITINLFPNPAINNIFFSANTIFHNVQILDLTGKEVLTEILNVNENSVNISKLPPGIYIIHFTNYTKKHYYEKFIKTD